MVICFPSSVPTTWGTFHLFLNFSSTFFLVFRAVGQVKYFSWNLTRMVYQTWGRNLQMVVWPSIQGYCKEEYASPLARCHSLIASFNPTPKFFLKLVIDILHSSFKYLILTLLVYVGDLLQKHLHCMHELLWDKQTTVFITHKELCAVSHERSV